MDLDQHILNDEFKGTLLLFCDRSLLSSKLTGTRVCKATSQKLSSECVTSQ